MFTVHAVQAQFGDSFILEFGTNSKRRFVMIDGGPPKNYAADLKTALNDIVGAGGKLDLVVLSHVDNDHVVGLLDLFAGLEEEHTNGANPSVSIGRLWHNSFRQTIDPNGEIIQRIQTVMTMAGSANVAMPFTTDAFLGISEGHRLRILAKKLKIPVNKGFSGDLIIVDTAAAPALKLGPLTLTIVGPTQSNLDALRTEWLKWLAKTEEAVAEDPSVASNADKSIPNLSSVVILAKCNGKTALFTGDARADHITEGLETAGLLQNGKLHVDMLKMQHHGSNRNVTVKFLKHITADTYVISANGKYDNPDHDTLKWIVEAANAAGRNIKIVVTNKTASTTKLKQTHKPADHAYTLTVKPAADHSIEIPLAK